MRARRGTSHALRPGREMSAIPPGRQVTYPASPPVPLTRPRHRSRCRRQDHRQVERVRRPRADAVGGDQVAGAAGQSCCSTRPMSDCRWPTSRISRSACSRNISSMTSGNWAARRCIVRRSTAARCLPPTRARRCRAIWRFDMFAEAKIDKNWTAEAVRQQHLQQALLRRAVPERGAVRAGGAGPRRLSGDLGEVLTTMSC